VRELALHVLDVLQNAVEAGATQVDLAIVEDHAADWLRILVCDNGRGMDAETLARVVDPFFTSRSTRHVGLGLPLFAAAAERSGGELSVQSQPGLGTAIEATFRLSYPDRQPVGNMADTLLAFLSSRSAPELNYKHCTDRAPGNGPAAFEFDTARMREVLGDLPLTHPAVQAWLAEFLSEGEETINGKT
jgi:hypothetical protein